MDLLIKNVNNVASMKQQKPISICLDIPKQLGDVAFPCAL